MVATLARQPSEGERWHLPGDINIWVFVLADLFSFAFYFVVFMVYRIEHGRVFLDSQRHLNLTAGTLNTLVLLASSRFVALTVHAARTGDHRRAARLVSLGGACGCVFVLIKVYEWSSEIAHGFTLPRNEFFMFYFALTGVHLFHLLIGLVVVALILRELRQPALRRTSMVEAGAVYWHMVDLVWVVLFALLYLMR